MLKIASSGLGIVLGRLGGFSKVVQQKRSAVKPGQEIGRPVPTGVLFLKTMDRKGFGGGVGRTPGTPQPGRQRPLVKSPNPDQYGREKPLGKVQGTDRIGVSWRQQETPDGIFHPLVDASRGNRSEERRVG